MSIKVSIHENLLNNCGEKVKETCPLKFKQAKDLKRYIVFSDYKL